MCLHSAVMSEMLYTSYNFNKYALKIAKGIPYHEDKMIFCLSYLHNGIFYTSKTGYSRW